MAITTLLLLRHGIAEEPRDGLADADRALTERGRQRTLAVLQHLMSVGSGVDLLLSSPLRRAHQTAQIALTAGWAPVLAIRPELAPGGALRPCLPAWLQELPGGGRRLGLVGHEPDLSQLAAALIGAPQAALQLRKAGLIELGLPPAFPAEPAVLLALLRPGLLLP